MLIACSTRATLGTPRLPLQPPFSPAIGEEVSAVRLRRTEHRDKRANAVSVPARIFTGTRSVLTAEELRAIKNDPSLLQPKSSCFQNQKRDAHHKKPDPSRPKSHLGAG